MKKQAISVLVVTIIFLSSVNMSILIRPVFGASTRDNLLNKIVNDNGASFRTNQISGNKSLTSSSSWNFSNPNEWIKSAYSEGNKTRLIIGLDNASYGKILNIEGLIGEYGAKLVDSISISQNNKALVVELPISTVSVFTRALQTLNSVRYIEPDLKFQLSFVPNDQYWSSQWGPRKIQADWAWNTTLGSKSVLVAIVDSGIDYNHPDLSQNYVPLGYNWIYNNSDPLDDNGHGTHVAGIIAALINNTIGVAGLAQVRIMAEKAFDSSGFGYDDVIAEAIIHAAQKGAKIISMSFGGLEDSQLIHDAVKAAYDNGTLLVAAAGNDDSNEQFYPASYPEVISVAATDQYDNKASFSNWGNTIELSAPGVDIYSTTPTYPVTLTEEGYTTSDYGYLSGTSMACPFVSGVAALVWSLHPNETRDYLRLWLRYTADDIGSPGYDEYYGYGRIDAFKAVNESGAQHDLVAYDWQTPPIIRLGASTTINATIMDFGENNETNVTVNVLANSTIVNSTSISLISAGSSTSISLYWSPTVQGTYNLTLYVEPVINETDIENNVLSKYVYVGTPIEAVVLRSEGNIDGNTITNWQTLNNQWYLFGSKAVNIDYTTLDKWNITYSDIAATGADVLIISCAFNTEFSDSEIQAITRYVHEGHGLIATAGTLYEGVPNNNKLAPLFGISENVSWVATNSDLMNLINATNPFLNKIPNPFGFPSYGSAIPIGGQWDNSVLNGGTYLALGEFLESAVVAFRGLVYISPWLETVPAYYHYPLQLIYNAITLSKYQPPQHDLEVSLQYPQYLKPGESSLLNATLTNVGLSNETNVTLGLFINGNFVDNVAVADLTVGSSASLPYLWTPSAKGTYNVTAYSPPVTNETYIRNNIAAGLVRVTEPLIDPTEGQYANYELSLGPMGNNVVERIHFQYTHYISPYQINVTMSVTVLPSNYTQEGWLIVNTFTRVVEQDSGIGWTGLWYPGLVETNLTIGSSISILNMNNITVTGSDIIFANGRPIDCWKIMTTMFGITYNFWYDKASGLWIAMEITGPVYEYLILNATNIPIGYMHDVIAMLNAPSLTAPGQNVILNVTAYNIGRSNETNVTIQLIINKTEVASKQIAALDINSSYTLSYSWTPTLQGIYNVTAYALPVLNENYTGNNTFTKLTKVGQVKGRVLFDQTHGTEDITSFSTWVENMSYEGYVVDTLSGQITPAKLNKYNVLIIAQASTAYDLNETNTIRDFVLSGNSLLVYGSDTSNIYTNLTSFANITWSYAYIEYGGIMSDITNHPITKGVTGVEFNPSASILSITSPAISIIRDPSGQTLLAVSEVGFGKVIAMSTGDSFSDSTIGYADNLRLAMNMVEWLAWKDTTPPSITITSPVNGTITRNTTLLVHWVGTDNDTRIRYYSVYLNENLVDSNVTTNNYTFTGLPQGTYNVTVVAYDVGMNSASDQITITVDLTPPSVNLITPANNSYVKGLVWVNTTCSDEHFELMTLSIDGVIVATYNKTGIYAYSWNTAGLEGQHTILLKGADEAGNTAQAQAQINVDNIRPIGGIIQPANATYVRGVVTIQVYAYDQNLESTGVFIDQNLMNDWGNETGIHLWIWNTATSTEGNHTISLTLTDKAGNNFEETVTVIVDNTSPHVSISIPANSSSINGTVNIDFTATDTNLGTVLLYIDNAIYNVTGQTNYSWNTQQLGDGSHTIRVVAIDKAGNTGQAQVNVITVNYGQQIAELLQRITNMQANFTANITQLQQHITGMQTNYAANVTLFQQRINSLEQTETNQASNITTLNKNNLSLQQLVTHLNYTIIGIIVAVAIVATLAYIISRRKPSVPNQT